MRAALVIARAVLGRLLARRRAVWLMLLGGSPAAILLLLSWGRFDSEAAQFYNDLTVSLGIGILYPVVALVVSTAALGEERKTRTLPFLLVKPVSRWVIALGASAAAVLASFAVLEAGVLATWLVAGFTSGDWSIGIPTTAAAAVQSLASAAIFVPLGLALNRATLAGLGYLLLWEGILAAVIEGLQGSSIYRIVLSAWADLADMTPDTYDTVNAILGRVEIGLGGAFAKAAVLIAVSVAVTGLLLRRRDLVGE